MGALGLLAAAVVGGCMPYRYATQGALHHAAALESPPADRVEGHLAGLQRELTDLAFIKNEVPEKDQRRLLAAVPWVARYLTDERARVRYSASEILFQLGRIHGDLPCEPIAAALLPDTAWLEGEAVVASIASDAMPPDVFGRFQLLLACADRKPGVLALAKRVLANPTLEAAAKPYNDAHALRSLADEIAKAAAAPGEAGEAPPRYWLWRRDQP